MMQPPFSNLQLEMLQIFSRNLNEQDLLEIKQLLANHFAKKATSSMDELWDKNKWDNSTMDNWLKTDFRKNESNG